MLTIRRYHLTGSNRVFWSESLDPDFGKADLASRYNAALLNRLVLENLRQRPIRTFLSVLAIGVEVTMILTLVGISYGTLDETACRARGVGADIVVRPPGTSVISLSSSPMNQDLLPFFMNQPASWQGNRSPLGARRGHELGGLQALGVQGWWKTGDCR